MAPRPAELTMVVPTYNERDRLSELTSAVFDAAAGAGLDLELVIVDDHSPDGTGDLADELARTRRMTVIHRASKLGLGSAVIAGFQIASADILGVMDADFSHPPALVPRMYSAFRASEADMLVASRYVPGGSTSHWPLRRRLLSRFACLLAQPLSPIRDATSGFFLIRRSVANGVTIHAAGFKIALELIVRAQPSSLVEMPYTFDDREQGVSKMTFREGTGYLRQLKALYGARSRRRPSRYRRLSLAEVAQAAQPRPRPGSGV